VTWLALPVVLLFAAVHLFAGRLRFISMRPRSRWLSFAGGVSVAYVFVHLLPEAAHLSDELDVPALPGSPIYLLALVGVVSFYGLERWVIRSQSGRSGHGRGEEGEVIDSDEAPGGVFWIHVGSFGLYNVLICDLLVREAQFSAFELTIYAVAMGLHFVVNDFGLQAHHRGLYRRYGRWLLAGSAGLGWLTGMLITTPSEVTAALFGLLCGATVLNVLKEELPAERESRFGAFALGAFAFAGLLLMLSSSASRVEPGPEAATRPGSHAVE
jgi:hypothetical protein